MSTEKQIIRLFSACQELTVKQLVDDTGASKQMVHLVLNKLLAADRIEKLGRAPKTIYRWITERHYVSEGSEIYLPEMDFLKKHFLLVDATGKILEGWPAFEYWCNQRNLPHKKTVDEFITTKKKYLSYFNIHGFINGTEKLKTTKGYDKIYLDHLFYLDFYAIERFGKTRLGTLLHYAKQGQSKYLMKIMMQEIADRIVEFVEKQKVDAIGFVPPTIRREVQIMKFIQANLKINLPILEIKKISGLIPVPQKSLSKLEERIANADNTFAITERKQFKHVILIDDAVGSGSTLNQISKKLKAKKTAKKITALAIVGSFKGFDVVTDV